MASRLTDADIATYHEDGLLFLRGLFDAEETDLLRRAMEEDPEIRDHSLLRADQEGGARDLALEQGRRQRLWARRPLQADRRNGGSSDW